MAEINNYIVGLGMGAGIVYSQLALLIALKWLEWSLSGYMFLMLVFGVAFCIYGGIGLNKRKKDGKKQEE